MNKQNKITLAICALSIIGALLMPQTKIHAQETTNINTVSSIQQQESTTSIGSQEKLENKVPLFNQCDYPDIPYGSYGTIESHGCGIVALSMVSTYLTGEFVDPVELAETYAGYNTPVGSSWSLFKNSAVDLGIKEPTQTYNWQEVIEALSDGNPVISIQGSGAFTTSGHFIVLTGITEDGKILVNDPNGYNWTQNSLVDGFKNGFTPQFIKAAGSCYWIYEK